MPQNHMDHRTGEFPNRGLFAEEVSHYVQGRQKTLFFTADGVTVLLHGKKRSFAVKVRPSRSETAKWPMKACRVVQDEADASIDGASALRNKVS